MATTAKIPKEASAQGVWCPLCAKEEGKRTGRLVPVVRD